MAKSGDPTGNIIAGPKAWLKGLFGNNNEPKPVAVVGRGQTFVNIQQGLEEGFARGEAEEQKSKERYDGLIRGLNMLQGMAGSTFTYEISPKPLAKGFTYIYTNLGLRPNPWIIRCDARNGNTMIILKEADTEPGFMLPCTHLEATQNKDTVLKFIAAQAAEQGLIPPTATAMPEQKNPAVMGAYNPDVMRGLYVLADDKSLSFKFKVQIEAGVMRFRTNIGEDGSGKKWRIDLSSDGLVRVLKGENENVREPTKDGVAVLDFISGELKARRAVVEMIAGLETLRDMDGSKFTFNTVGPRINSMLVSTNIGEPPMLISVVRGGCVTAFRLSGGNGGKQPLIQTPLLPATENRGEALKFIAAQAQAKGLIF